MQDPDPTLRLENERKIQKLQIQFIIKFKKTYFFINVKLIHLIEEQRQPILQTTW